VRAEYIAAKLREQGIKPVGSADARTLLRRVTFDLTGLPPTPVEVGAFAKAWDAAGDKQGEIWQATMRAAAAAAAARGGHGGGRRVAAVGRGADQVAKFAT
jgi:hypothetical protein